MRLKNRLQYAKKPESISRPLLKSPLNKGTISRNLYQDCRVPLDIFLECMFDKDYSRLIRSGRPDRSEVLEAWGKIYVQYADMVNDESGNDAYDLTIEINYLAAKVFIVDKCVKHFMVSWNDELFKILRYYGVSCGLKLEDDIDTRSAKLANTVAMAKRWNVQLDVLWKQFNELQDNSETNKSGIEAFEDNLSSISAFRKYSVLAKDISVRQYIKALKGMEREYMRLMSKQ